MHTCFQIALWEFNKHFNLVELTWVGWRWQEPPAGQNAVFTALWELSVWQDLFLGQEGLVVTAVDNQLEWKEEGIATGLTQLTENGSSKHGAVASCLYRAVNIMEELGQSLAVLMSKLRTQSEHSFMSLQMRGHFLLSQKMHTHRGT